MSPFAQRRWSARLMRRAGLSLGRLRAWRAGLQSGVQIGSGVVLGAGCNLWCSPGSRIIIGSGAVILAHSSITAEPGASAEIGERTFIGPYSMIAAVDRVTIGNDCMLAEMVSIRDHDHDPAYPPLAGKLSVDPIVIGNRVWIAAKASVGRGVKIGDDAVVAGHAFVSRSVESQTLVGGVPARVIRRDIRGT